MARITQRPQIKLEVTFTIDEEEARALDGLTGYEFESFFKCFTENMGASYIEKHKEGLRRFFESIRKDIPAMLSRTDAARQKFRQ